MRTWVGSSSLTVALYGTPLHRRVVSDVRPLVATGPPPVKNVANPDLLRGERAVEDTGEPSRSTSVRRLVYDASGKLLSDATFYSSYRAEPKIVEVGTKPNPAQPRRTRKKKKTPTTTSATTPSASTSTSKTPTTPQP